MLPLVAKGEAIGLVELTFEGRPLTDASLITLARTMAHEAAMALENARLYETRARPRRPRPADRLLQPPLPPRAAVRGGRAGRPDPAAAVSVVMLDLDDFKVVNDSYGHVYGDGVLVHVAELIRGDAARARTSRRATAATSSR